MAGRGHGHRPAAEAQLIAIVQRPVDLDRRRLDGRDLPADLLEDGAFPVGQVRGRPRLRAVQVGRIRLVGQHRDTAASGRDLSRRSGMIGVKVREHHLAQVPRLPAKTADRRRDLRGRPGNTGVDARQAASVLAQVGVPDRQTQPVQPRDQFNGIHTADGRPCCGNMNGAGLTGTATHWQKGLGA
jgi:hypothetical protein